MVDWKKEIKLSDFVGRKKNAPVASNGSSPNGAAPAATSATGTRERQSRLKRDVSFRRRGAAESRTTPAKQAPVRQRGSKKGQTLVGLKIGASQLAAARIANGGGTPQLLQVAREPLAHGVVGGGEVRDVDTLAAALESFFAKHKLPRRGVRLGVASNRIGVRHLEISGIEDERQLANAIRFRAQEALPIPIDEAVLDYHVLGETTVDGTRTRRILLVVAYRDLIDRYATACAEAGIELVGIDLEAFALLRALATTSPNGSSDAALVAVAVGHDRSTLAVSDGTACEFTRVVEWGGAAFDGAIGRALHVVPEEAEELKLALSIDEAAPLPEGITAEQAAVVRDALRRELQNFARELVSSLQFYQSQPGSLAIGEIVLTGGTSDMPGLSNELGRLIGVPVRVGDPLARVAVADGVAARDGVGSLAVAIGLGIED